jgi:hypothetical protein
MQNKVKCHSLSFQKFRSTNRFDLKFTVWYNRGIPMVQLTAQNENEVFSGAMNDC